MALVEAKDSQRPLVVALVSSLAAHGALLWALSLGSPGQAARDDAPPLLWVHVVEPPAIDAAEPAPPPRPVVARQAPAPAPAAPVPSAEPSPPPTVEAAPPVVAPRRTLSLDELRILRNRRPSYPRSARLRGAEGVTLLRVLVERSGHVGEVEIERSAGDAELDRAARRAVRGWRFAALPSPREVLIPVEFRLR